MLVECGIEWVLEGWNKFPDGPIMLIYPCRNLIFDYLPLYKKILHKYSFRVGREMNRRRSSPEQ